MKLSNLLDRLDGIITTTNLSIQILPPMLIECGVMTRSGLSAIRATQDIVKSLAAAGFPIESNTDGTSNMTVAFSYVMVKGLIDEIVKNGVVQVPVRIAEAAITLLGLLM